VQRFTTIIVGAGHKLVKARAQLKAGSTVAGLLTTEGTVQQYIDKAQRS